MLLPPDPRQQKCFPEQITLGRPINHSMCNGLWAEGSQNLLSHPLRSWRGRPVQARGPWRREHAITHARGLSLRPVSLGLKQMRCGGYCSSYLFLFVLAVSLVLEHIPTVSRVCAMPGSPWKELAGIAPLEHLTRTPRVPNTAVRSVLKDCLAVSLVWVRMRAS